MDAFAALYMIFTTIISFHIAHQQGINTGLRAAVERPLGFGQVQPQFGSAPFEQQGGFGRGGPQQSRFSQQSQFVLQQQQSRLLGQPSLVNIGGCSRGVSLRNADGSTLVCGFGPRDFSCPQGFACVLDSALRSLVCCPADNTTGSGLESADTPLNPCHEGEPIKDEFGNRLKCTLVGPATSCPTATICVEGACCPVSIAGLVSVKAGKCPLPLPVPHGSTCQNDCTFDADCPGVAKCCFVGCGARCVTSSAFGAPLGPDGFSGLANPSVGGPLSGNGATLGQFNLVPTRKDGIFFLQQQQRRQLAQQFGQQNIRGPQDPRLLQQLTNNGPPGSARRGPPRGAPGNTFGLPQQNRQPQLSPLNRQFDQINQ